MVEAGEVLGFGGPLRFRARARLSTKAVEGSPMVVVLPPSRLGNHEGPARYGRKGSINIPTFLDGHIRTIGQALRF